VPSDLTLSLAGWSAGDGPRPPVDAAGCEWTLQSFGGWFDGAEVRAAPVNPADGRDGVIDGRFSFGGRTITVAGYCHCPDRASRVQAMRALGGLLAGPVRRETLTVAESVTGVSLQAVVRLLGPTVSVPAGLGGFSWSLSLFAPDPVKYGTTLRQVSSPRATPGGDFVVPAVVPFVFGPAGGSGWLSATNGGTADVWPVVRFTGPLADPQIRVVGGAALGAVIELAAGEELVVDMQARTVLLGSSTRRASLTFESEWFSLPPGQTELLFTAAGGAGTCTVQWRDGWA